MLGCLDYGGGLEGREAGAVGAVGGVAHEAVEGGPDGAEDLGWGAEGGLLEGHVSVLGLLGCGEVLVVSEPRGNGV